MTFASPAQRTAVCSPGPAQGGVVPPNAEWSASEAGDQAQEPLQFAGPLRTTDFEAIEALVRVFERHRLNRIGLNEALGQAAQRLERADIPLHERRLAAATPLHTLLKLFTLRLVVSKTSAQMAFAPISLERLIALGILDAEAKGVRAQVGLSFCDELRLFHDAMVDSPEQLRPDHVLGINPSAVTLANLTVRASVRCALDVGTGCGVQALLAAKHSESVIGSDTNPRALNYAQFNARMNRVTNVDFRLGSLFEPVAGSKFDLIICNPPFVISPESEYQFRDSGLRADELSERVVRAAPDFLNEGGFASILCSWAHWKEEDWSTRPLAWAADSGCDAYALRGRTEDPLGHAALWNEGHDPVAYGNKLDLWQEYYQQLGIRALTVGAVILRRRSSGANWTRKDELPKKLTGSCSAYILRATQAEDLLAGLSSEDELLDHIFDVPPNHRLNQTMVHERGDFVIQKIEMELPDGLQFVGKLDPVSFQMVRMCDGQRTLRSVVTEIAGMGKTTLEQIRDQVCRVAREMIRCGFLVPIRGTKAGEAGSPCGGSGVAAKSQRMPGPCPGSTEKG